MASTDLDATFVLNDIPAVAFMRFIGNLRSLVMDPERPAPLADHRDLRLLQPTRSGPPQRWLRLRIRVARSDHNEIIVWIRADNLYVVGFERARAGDRSTPGPRFELAETGQEEKDKGKNKRAKKKGGDGQHQQLIPGSQFLGFGGGYNDLNGASLAQVPPVVGWNALTQAIYGLGRYPEERAQSAGQIRSWLRTIIITFSESMRLHPVCRFLHNQLGQNTDNTLEDKLCRLVNCWGNLCDAVINCANDPQGDDAERERERYREFKRAGLCKSTDEACEIVAILNHGPPAAQDKPKRPKREARTRAVGDVPEGLTFAEIFSVDIGRSSRNLYGEITIDDGISKQELFKRLRSGYLRAGQGELPYLTGPSRAVWGHGEVVMHVDLMDAVGSPDMTPDREVGSGTLVLNTYDTPAVEYDKVLEYEFQGLSGAVDVRCALITNAVVATVTVIHTGKVPKYVFGKLSATTVKFGQAVTLFKRDWKDAVFVQPGNHIALNRKVAVVPLDSALRITASLFARATVQDMTPDAQILKDDRVLDAVTAGTTEKTMSNDDITVWVTWSVN